MHFMTVLVINKSIFVIKNIINLTNFLIDTLELRVSELNIIITS